MSGLEIRPAREIERFEILAMCRDFHTASGIPLAFDPAYASLSVADFIADPAKLALVLVSDGMLGGILAASVTPSPLSPVLLAQEVIWWIAPALRGRAALPMLRAYDDWARGMGCAAVGVSALNDPRVARLFGRAGFDLIENKFLKVL